VATSSSRFDPIVQGTPCAAAKLTIDFGNGAPWLGLDLSGGYCSRRRTRDCRSPGFAPRFLPHPGCGLTE
jgi:hypothetical protein